MLAKGQSPIQRVVPSSKCIYQPPCLVVLMQELDFRLKKCYLFSKTEYNCSRVCLPEISFQDRLKPQRSCDSNAGSFSLWLLFPQTVMMLCLDLGLGKCSRSHISQIVGKLLQVSNCPDCLTRFPTASRWADVEHKEYISSGEITRL